MAASASAPAGKRSRSAAKAALELANRLSVRWAIDDLMGVAIGQMRGARAVVPKLILNWFEELRTRASR